MMLRYFAVVAPGAAGDPGHAYLVALAATGIRIRALPIGPAAMSSEKRWSEVVELFTTPMSIPFVNIVCAPMGMPLGAPTSMRAFGGTQDLVKQEGATTDVMVFPAELRAVLGDSKDAPDIMYEPTTALAGLHTEGCRNIAIVAGGKPMRQDIAALARYDAVIASADDAAKIPVIQTRQLGPDAAPLLALLEEVVSCASGGSATGVNLRDTVAPHAITWLLSPASKESSSKSEASATQDASLRSRATSTSTSSSFPGIALREPWTWRSIMRSLAFWRRSSP